MQIGDRIKELRKGKKMSQTELANKSDMAMMSIRRYESGEREPKASDLKKIAEALGTDTMYLLHGQTAPERAGTLFHEVSEETNMVHVKQRMNEDFDTLNPSGQREAAKRVHELMQIDEYTKEG